MDFTFSTSQTPRQILERAAQEKLVGKKGTSIKLNFEPGLNEKEVAALEGRISASLPPEIRELLQFSTGFDLGLLPETPYWDDQPFVVSWNDVGNFGLDEVFPCSTSLLSDGCGNEWVVDINPESGLWGPVFFACHDPPVIVVQAANLAVFLEQIFDVCRAEHKDALEKVTEELTGRIWGDDPYSVPAETAQASNDPAVSAFARGVSEHFRVTDLRGARFGEGFTWAHNPKWETRRCGHELLFAVEKRPSLLKRLFGRT